MPRTNYRWKLPTRYTPLIAYLAAQEGNHVTLTFAEIEAIIGVPLSVSAQVSDAIWMSQRERLGRDLAASGWRAHLRVRGHAVTFQRIN
jgi:hypothetical protein